VCSLRRQVLQGEAEGLQGSAVTNAVTRVLMAVEALQAETSEEVEEEEEEIADSKGKGPASSRKKAKREHPGRVKA
jgi:hypothetical protein